MSNNLNRHFGSTINNTSKSTNTSHSINAIHSSNARHSSNASHSSNANNTSSLKSANHLTPNASKNTKKMDFLVVFGKKLDFRKTQIIM